MSDYVPERGYRLGPTLDVGEKAWPLLWEQRDGLDDCRHEWERVVRRYRHSAPDEPVVRCRACHVPRCGDSDDRDPCMERRHHHDLHVHLSGLFRPIGDIVRCHVEGCRHTAAMCPDHPPADPVDPAANDGEGA